MRLLQPLDESQAKWYGTEHIVYKTLLYLLLIGVIRYLMQLVPRENFGFLIMGITFSFFVFGLLIWSFRSISWKEILLVSCLMRLSLIDVPVQWSDDIYRFFWDGMKVRHLESPYQMTPSEDERRTEWEALYSQMNSVSFFSPYPPVLQYIWALTGNTTGNPIFLRLLWIAVDMGCIYLLHRLLARAQRARWHVLCYAWNPLVLIEGIGQLHPEVLMLFFVLLGLWCFENHWNFGLGLSIGLAICTKLWPVLILPLLINRMSRADWIRTSTIALGVCIVLFVPLLRPSALSGMASSFLLYYQSFEFNASLYYVIKGIYNWMVPESGGAMVSRWLGVAWLVFVARLIWGRQLTLPVALYCTFFVLALTSAVVHPWYLIPLLAYGLLANRFAILFWSPLVFMSYSHYANGQFQEEAAWIAAEYLLLAAFLWAEWKLRTDMTLGEAERIKE